MSETRVYPRMLQNNREHVWEHDDSPADQGVHNISDTLKLGRLKKVAELFHASRARIQSKPIQDIPISEWVIICNN